MKWTRRLAASFRQTLYPEEFRLPEAEFEEEQLNLLEELIQMVERYEPVEEQPGHRVLMGFRVTGPRQPQAWRSPSS